MDWGFSCGLLPVLTNTEFINLHRGMSSGRAGFRAGWFSSSRISTAPLPPFLSRLTTHTVDCILRLAARCLQQLWAAGTNSTPNKQKGPWLQGKMPLSRGRPPRRRIFFSSHWTESDHMANAEPILIRDANQINPPLEPPQAFMAGGQRCQTEAL